MESFAYLSILASIVLALGITRVLPELGRLLQARGRFKLYWVHLLWALLLFHPRCPALADRFPGHGLERLGTFDRLSADLPHHSVFTLTLNTVAATTREEWFHEFFAVFFLFYWLLFIGINLRVVS